MDKDKTAEDEKKRNKQKMDEYNALPPSLVGTPWRPAMCVF